MCILEWKKANLATLHLLESALKLEKVAIHLYNICYNNDYIVICDSDGWIHIYSNKWDLTASRGHYGCIRLCAITNENNYLVTLAQENDLSVLKVFDLQNVSYSGKLNSLCTVELAFSSPANVIQTCVIGPQLCIVIGLNNGDLLIHRSALSRELIIHFRTLSFIAQRITGIEFKKRDHLSCSMFISSELGIYCFTVSENNIPNDTKVVLDGCTLSASCCSLRSGTSEEQYFVVGCYDAVYCFTPDNRGACYVVKGEKRCVVWFKNYLIIVFNKSNNLLKESYSELVIIDICHKIVVLKRELELIDHIISNNNDCYVLTHSKKIFLLKDRSLQSKLRILMDKNMYDSALQLIDGYNNLHELGELHKKFGDFLLNNGDPVGAVEKYIKTIGTVNPHYVIKKLLSLKKNTYLSQYLTALVHEKCVNTDILELLYRCDQRINITENINAICDQTSYATSNYNCIDFKLLNEQNSINLPSFVKKLHNIDDACEFLHNLKEEEIQDFFVRHSFLLENYSLSVVEILKAVYNKRYIENRKDSQNSDRFLPMFLHLNNLCINFTEYLLSINISNASILNFIFEHYLRDWKLKKKRADEVIDFMSKYIVNANIDHIFILCKNYSYWPGIMFIYENYPSQYIYIKYCKDMLNQKGLTSFLQCDFPYIILKYCDNKFSDKTHNEMDKILKTLCNKSNQSVLQIFKNLLTNRHFRLLHIKSVFKNSDSKRLLSSKHRSTTVNNLYANLNSLTSLLHNFSEKPIEIRSSTCSACKQAFRLPAICYLCQHFFHKDCFYTYPEKNVCIVCDSKRNQIAQFKDSTSNSSIESPSKVVSDENIICYISMNLSYILYEQKCFIIKRTVIDPLNSFPSDTIQEWRGRFKKHIPQSKSNNPFENEDSPSNNTFDEYDNNLNLL